MWIDRERLDNHVSMSDDGEPVGKELLVNTETGDSVAALCSCVQIVGLTET